MDVGVELSVNSRIRDQVNKVYGEAAREPKGLCCPKDMPKQFVDHVPAEAFAHSYGCGSPIVGAGVGAGETVVDLGCGVGIDCFAAAKLVGPAGRVVGVDLSNDMLAKAYSFNVIVARNLGYDVVSFRKGSAEQIPLEDGVVDLLVSNCVVNLATDKTKVFKEVYRVLRHGGRLVISDVVSDRDIRPEDKADPSEWAECTVSTLSLRAFLASLAEAGFIGLRQIAEEPWRQVKGYHLSSITLEARKFETDCHAGVGHLAIYLGPHAEVKDDLGNSFPRFRPVAVRDDIANFMRKGGGGGAFIVVAGRATAAPKRAVAPGPAKPAEDRRASPCCDPTDKVTQCCDDNGPKADGSPCCDPLAAQQPAGCGCAVGEATSAPVATVPAAAIPVSRPLGGTPQATAASACCDAGGGGCGPAPTASVEAKALQAATPVVAASSGCCDTDASSGCGPGSACGPAAITAPQAALPAPVAVDECCPCETEAKGSGTDCCGSGCGTCGCS